METTVGVQELTEILAENLRALRVSLDYTQNDMADILQISRSAYTYYEIGHTQPSLYSLYLISQVFQVPVDLFLRRECLKNKNRNFLNAQLAASRDWSAKYTRLTRAMRAMDQQQLKALWNSAAQILGKIEAQQP